MPFTNTPINDTYSSKKVLFLQQLDTLPGDSFTTSSMLSGLQNVLPFQDQAINGGDVFVETRQSLTNIYSQQGASVLARGFYVWEKTAGTVYYFVALTDGTNSKIYSSPDGSVFTAVVTFGTNGTGPIRFTEFINGSNVKSLIAVDGYEGYVFTTNAAVTKITDLDFPNPHLPFPIFLDGYLFLAEPSTGDIFNSDLNDPSSWTAGSYISSELYPDDLQALVKINNYILAVGTQGCEYFYDAANATASPLARQEGMSLPFGTIFPNSIAYSKNTAIMLTNNNDGEYVFRVVQDFKHHDVSANIVLKFLKEALQNGHTTASKVRGTFFRQNGDLFYLFHINGEDTGGTYDSCLYYSPTHKLWGVLSVGSSSSFPVMFTSQGTSLNPSTVYLGHTKVSGTQTLYFGRMVDNDKDSLLSTYDIQQYIICQPESFGTNNLKFMSRASLICDSLTTAITPTLKLQWWDGAYNLGRTTTTISFPLASSQNLWDLHYTITQLGCFRQRQFTVSQQNSDNAGGRMRYKYLEVDINKGQQ
jgi:hypothetical protein